MGGEYLSVSTQTKVGSPEFSHQGSMDTGFLRTACGANETWLLPHSAYISCQVYGLWLCSAQVLKSPEDR